MIVFGVFSRFRIIGRGLFPILLVACGSDPGGPHLGQAAVRVILDLQAVMPATAIVSAERLSISVSRVGQATPVVDTLLPLPQGVASLDVVLSVPVGDEARMFSILASVLTGVGDTAFLSTPDTVALSTDDSDPIPVNFTFHVAWETIDAGDFVTCALAAGGLAFCWGHTTFGQLGDGVIGADTNTVPTPVLGGLRYTTISVGGFAVCGIVEDGQIHCWGTDLDGTLGDGLPAGPGNQRAEPGPVAGGHEWSSVTVGYHHACGLTTGGGTYCWGNNHRGQLGAVSSDTCAGEACSATPIAFSAVANVRQISAGIGSTCVLDDAGMSYCSDFNAPAAGFQSFAAPGGLSFERVSAGGVYQCGQSSDQTGSCWGTSNLSGQLGSGGTDASNIPSPLPSIGALRMITANSANAQLTHSCAVTRNGQAYCWGWADDGQLGAAAGGACLFNTAFVQCHTVPLAVDTDLTFATVTVGYRHTCGMTTDRRVFCWGANDRGQLGNGTLTGSTNPVEVLPPS